MTQTRNRALTSTSRASAASLRPRSEADPRRAFLATDIAAILGSADNVPANPLRLPRRRHRGATRAISTPEACRWSASYRRLQARVTSAGFPFTYEKGAKAGTTGVSPRRACCIDWERVDGRVVYTHRRRCNRRYRRRGTRIRGGLTRIIAERLGALAFNCRGHASRQGAAWPRQFRSSRMINLTGTITVKTINGRNGDFNVGA